MKRRVVQHGPSTLTISLPSRWVQDRGIKKGDELTVASMQSGLLITTTTSRKPEMKRISVKGLSRIIAKAVAALYKYGYDEIIVEYSSPEELEKVHAVLTETCLGFEVIEETKSEVHIRKVTEPQNEEFKTLFRRIFHFLLTTADETHEAAKQHSVQSHEKLVFRDDNINKLADFCRRVINKGGQTMYKSDTALYHVVEQLEKVGDCYKHLNQKLAKKRSPCSKEFLAIFAETNLFLRSFEDFFFNFSLDKGEALYKGYLSLGERVEEAMEALPKEELSLLFLVEDVAEELYNLLGATMIIQL